MSDPDSLAIIRAIEVIRDALKTKKLSKVESISDISTICDAAQEISCTKLVAACIRRKKTIDDNKSILQRQAEIVGSNKTPFSLVDIISGDYQPTKDMFLLSNGRELSNYITLTINDPKWLDEAIAHISSEFDKDNFNYTFANGYLYASNAHADAFQQPKYQSLFRYPTETIKGAYAINILAYWNLSISNLSLPQLPEFYHKYLVANYHFKDIDSAGRKPASRITVCERRTPTP